MNMKYGTVHRYSYFKLTHIQFRKSQTGARIYLGIFQLLIQSFFLIILIRLTTELHFSLITAYYMSHSVVETKANQIM